MDKICILQNGLYYGGTDTFVLNLCKGLIQDGYEVTVVLSEEPHNISPRENELFDIGVEIIKTSSIQNGIKCKLKHLILLYKILKKGRYSVFQTNVDLFNGPQVFVAWLAKVPVRECHSHNSQQGRELKEGRTIAVRVYQSLMRLLCWNFSNRRCGCSEDALDFLFGNKWRRDSRAKVIHNGIDLNAYQSPFDTEKKRKETDIEKRYVIATVGRISYQKNPEFLLDTFYELTKTRDDVELIWCGTGELEDIIKRRIKTYGIERNVHLLGTRDDISELMKCSNLFLLPSRFEGLGIVLIEAQAAGLPCVISDVIPDEANCGGCLSLSLDESPRYWADKVSDILDGKITLSADQVLIEEYSVDHMVKEMEDVFRK
ncbi:glycosyltransferase [Faecalimonas umbilicata]|nr:glycosyltransferase [Faecalimonas umbilicata]